MQLFVHIRLFTYVCCSHANERSKKFFNRTKILPSDDKVKSWPLSKNKREKHKLFKNPWIFKGYFLFNQDLSYDETITRPDSYHSKSRHVRQVTTRRITCARSQQVTPRASGHTKSHHVRQVTQSHTTCVNSQDTNTKQCSAWELASGARNTERTLEEERVARTGNVEFFLQLWSEGSVKI